MLITPKELFAQLQNPSLLIIDTRSFKEYAQGHIPGAVNLDLFSLHWYDTSKHGLQEFERQSKRILSFVGITRKNKVVFYDDVSGMLAARGVWLLMYFSHPSAFMLDGGINKWKAENLPLQTKTNGFTPAKFDGKPNRKIIADYNTVKRNLLKAVLIDARSKQEYDGTIIRGARRGHIPGAINIDYTQNIAKDGTYLDNKELEKLYQIPNDAQIITYCQGAFRAANSFLALKKLGFKNVRVYLGSWAEWSNRTDLPVE